MMRGAPQYRDAGGASPSSARRGEGGLGMASPGHGVTFAGRHVSDTLEHEADRVADAVVRGDPPGTIGAATRGIPQRAAAAGARSVGAGPGSLLPPSPGKALAPATRRYFETRLDADLGGVRVHADASANGRAAALGARAFTVGGDIVFGAGEFRPDSREGKRLLAHELAHTVQQARGAEPAVQLKLKVGAGLKLDTKGWSVTKTGDEYSAPKALRGGSVWNEIFSSLLASPRTFEIAGATNAEVDSNLAAHMKARLGIVAFAANKKYKFGAGANFKMNPDFWDVGSGGPKPKPGVDRQKAIEDINNPKNVGDPVKEYAIACQAATMLTMEGGAKSGSFQSNPSSDPMDWVPGDRGYIKNIKFNAATDSVGLEGENLIYVGKYMFWGHFNPGLEYKLLDDWMAEVDSFTATSEARLMNTRQWTKVGLL